MKLHINFFDNKKNAIDMKKLLLILLIIVVQGFVFGQNDSLKSKKNYKIGIAVGTYINPMKRDMYFPYTAYDRFYLPTINDSMNFYKNTFGFLSRLRPTFEVFYCSKNKFFHALEIAYTRKKEHNTLGGNTNYGDSYLVLHQYTAAYTFKTFLFSKKLREQIMPFVGIKLNTAYKKVDYNEMINYMWEVYDSVNFKQNIFDVNLCPVIGLSGIWKHIYYEAGVGLQMIDYVNTNYTSNSVYTEKYSTIMPETRTKTGKDSHILFLMRTNFFIHLGYSF